MNLAILWDIEQFSLYVNRRFGGTYHLHLQGKESTEQETSLQQVGRHLPGFSLPKIKKKD
jgi:hypothetical protein